MTSIRVALLQMIGSGRDKLANLVNGELFCRRAREMGADIALFPEMWSVGMTFFDPAVEGDHDQWKDLAITRDDALIHLTRLNVKAKRS